MTEMRFPYIQWIRAEMEKKSTTRLDWKLTNYNKELMGKNAIRKEVWSLIGPLRESQSNHPSKNCLLSKFIPPKDTACLWAGTSLW